MLDPTTGFVEEIREVWGNPGKVADVAFCELFRHEDDVCLDYDEQVAFAKELGSLAETMKSATPEGFVAAFTKNILN